MADWTVLVPAKPVASAKTRLQPPADVDKRLLVQSMLDDVVAAVGASSQVARIIVVTCDPGIERSVRREGAEVMREPWPTDLNASLDRARHQLSDRRPLAVVTGDLPALRGTDIDTVLDRAAEHSRAHVADGQLTGTTILTAARPSLLIPRYGPGSAQAHTDAGHLRITAPAAARRDVDTWDDLLDAVRLNLGSHTSTALGPASARAANRLIAPPTDTAQETRHVALAG